MAKIFGRALARAVPQLMTMQGQVADLQERAKRLRMAEETHATNQAMANIQLANIKEEQAFGESMMDIRLLPGYRYLDEEAQTEAISFFNKSGLTDEIGRGQRKNIMRGLRMMFENKEMGTYFLNDAAEKMFKQIQTLETEIQEEMGINPEKAQKKQPMLNSLYKQYYTILNQGKNLFSWYKQQEEAVPTTKEIGDKLYQWNPQTKAWDLAISPKGDIIPDELAIKLDVPSGITYKHAKDIGAKIQYSKSDGIVIIKPGAIVLDKKTGNELYRIPEVAEEPIPPEIAKEMGIPENLWGTVTTEQAKDWGYKVQYTDPAKPTKLRPNDRLIDAQGNIIAEYTPETKDEWVKVGPGQSIYNTITKEIITFPPKPGEGKFIKLRSGEALFDPETKTITTFPELAEEEKPTDDIKEWRIWQDNQKELGIIDPKKLSFDYYMQNVKRQPPVQVNISQQQETAQAKQIGEFYGKQYAEMQQTAISAQSRINKIDSLIKLLEGVDTGKLTPLGTELAASAKSFGIDIDSKLGNKQAAISVSRWLALEYRNPSGGAGMPGAMSDADREFLISIPPGIEKTPEGNKLIINVIKKLAQRDIEVAKLARAYKKKYGQLDEDFYDELFEFSKKNPLFNSAQSKGKTQSKPFDERYNELKKQGLSEDRIFDQLNKEGY